MERMRKRWYSVYVMTAGAKFIAILLVLAIVAGFVIFFRDRNGAVTEKNSNPSPVAATSTSSAGLTPPRSTSKAIVSKPTAFSNSLKSVMVILPQDGDTWRINTPHTIELNKQAGATGSVSLMDAVTKEVIGFISPVWGDSQTSLVWDTQTVSLTRSSNQKKQIQPGTYIIKAAFDTQIPYSISGNFRIVGADDLETVTYSVRLKDFTATPSVLTVRRGAKVIFINNDLKKQTISAAGFGPITMDAGMTFTLDTATLKSGSYFYASDLYLNRGRGTLIVE